MKEELIKELDNFTINCNVGLLVSSVDNLENGKFVYSSTIEDSFWNFISNVNAGNKEEFNIIWEANRKKMLDKNRVPTLYITPNSNLIDKYETILPEYMKIESKEIWMLFNDFKSLKPYTKHTNLNIKINNKNNLKEFADVFIKSYDSSSEEDPYGEMPEYYKTTLLNYKEDNVYKKTFYTVSLDDKDIACAMTIEKDNIALLGFVGTIKEYRGKGICKNLMNKILNDLKDKNIEYAYLQTEEGYIPEKLYSKLGFITVCKAIIAVEDKGLYERELI